MDLKTRILNLIQELHEIIESFEELGQLQDPEYEQLRLIKIDQARLVLQTLQGKLQ